MLKAISREPFNLTTHQAMQVAVALACTLGSVSIGLAYADQVYIRGWQAVTWLVCVASMVFILTPRFPFPIRWTWIIGGVALFVIALALRLSGLDHIPGAFHVDEVGVAGFAQEQIFLPDGQTVSPFVTGSASQPTLYHSLVRFAIDLFGKDIAAARLPSVLGGALAVVATYLMMLTFENRRMALFTATLMAGYHFHIHWSRLALNNIYDTLWLPLSLAAFAWGWRKGWSGGAVVSGLAIGLSWYFYSGSRVGLFLLAYLIFCYWRERPDRRRWWIYLGKFSLTAIAVAAPIVIFAVTNPNIYLFRTRQAIGWTPEAIKVISGGPLNISQYAWFQLTRSLGAFTVYPDVTGFYGPDAPLVFGTAAMLFLVGAVWMVYRRNWLPLLWLLLVAFFGGFLMGGAPSSSHYVTAIPAICWLVAAPLDWLYENGHIRLTYFLLAVVLASDLYFYFGIYVPGHPRDLILQFPIILR